MALHQDHTLSMPGALDVQTSTINELLTLPEMNETLALAIVRARPFSSIEELGRKLNLPKGQLKWLLPFLKERAPIHTQPNTQLVQ